MPHSSKHHIVWMDLEMSGLDPKKDHILEIATLITDKHLNIIATGPELVISQPLHVLQNMDQWNTEHHKASGLWDKVLKSHISLEHAEKQTLDFIKTLTQPQKNPLAGNSVWQDRRFISKYMPHIHKHLHYRLIDVSTINELAQRWYPSLKLPKKQGAHRALGDIQESIQELIFFKKTIFQEPNDISLL